MAQTCRAWQVRTPGRLLDLGWQINESRGVAGQAGYARSAAASLVVRLDSGKVHVALTNRGIPIEESNGRVVHALAHS
jgi:hypothetical protein